MTYPILPITITTIRPTTSTTTTIITIIIISIAHLIGYVAHVLLSFLRRKRWPEVHCQFLLMLHYQFPFLEWKRQAPSLIDVFISKVHSSTRVTQAFHACTHPSIHPSFQHSSILHWTEPRRIMPHNKGQLHEVQQEINRFQSFALYKSFEWYLTKQQSHFYEIPSQTRYSSPTYDKRTWHFTRLYLN